MSGAQLASAFRIVAKASAQVCHAAKDAREQCRNRLKCVCEARQEKKSRFSESLVL